MVAGLVGRRDEIARVTTVLRDVVGGGAGKVVVVRGEPGIGKSALLSATRGATGLGYRVWRAALTLPSRACRGPDWRTSTPGWARPTDGVVAAHAERLAVAAASAQPAAQPDTRSADIAPDSEAAAHESVDIAPTPKPLPTSPSTSPRLRSRCPRVVDIAPETVAARSPLALDVFRHHGEQSGSAAGGDRRPAVVGRRDRRRTLHVAQHRTSPRRRAAGGTLRRCDPLEPNRLVDADTLIELRLKDSARPSCAT